MILFIVKLVMCGAFYPNYFLKGSVDEESALREMSGNDPLNTVMVKLQGSITRLQEISILIWNSVVGFLYEDTLRCIYI